MRARAGLGRALLAELIKLCEELGNRQMITLIAGGTENPSSVRLHDRLGFRQIDLMDGSAFKHGRWIDTLLMLRAHGGKRIVATGQLGTGLIVHTQVNYPLRKYA
jgi:phosphinothricin acetyltransferase